MIANQPDSQSQSARAEWMSVLAQAAEADLSHHWRRFRKKPGFAFLKKPEHGCILLRGRIGGDGPPFHCGEMTVTRCVIQLDDGRIGVAYVPGRSHDHAITAAVLDALMQADDAPGLRARRIVEALRLCALERRAEVTAKTRATKVEFAMTAIG
jgi:alpha-D-ribose 1-methylphosphonate 5-triphosphate synthase subunit PhnG